MKQIGFLGLGSMGLPMASNLIAAGFAVRGYDISEAALARFAAAGGERASSPRQAAVDADLLALMVVNAEQAADLLFGDGALAALPDGAIVLLMATCPPAAVEALARRVEEAGRFLIDAPVSGGVVGAKAGTLSIMVAASESLLDRVRPALDVLGERIFHVGERPGLGSIAKTVNQLLCGVHLAAAAEALSLAEKAGMDPAVALEIVSGSSASSWMLRDRGPRMLMELPPVTSAVDIFVKDLGIVLSAGTSVRTALPLAAAAHQMFLATSGQGRGSEDDSKVIAAYRTLSRSQSER
jgi:3-hydroxyisobutyrate dehydrogenase